MSRGGKDMIWLLFLCMFFGNLFYCSLELEFVLEKFKVFFF